jgi:hypothetical protein
MSAWDGDSWQTYCMQLVTAHCGPAEVQQVPARFGGDLGIEAFSRDGCVYQCYAAEEPYNADELYPKQRDKLTGDLRKLVQNENDIRTLMGGLLIRRYVFMAPLILDRRIIEHATSKSHELNELRLSILADDFVITVVTDDAYAIERAQLVSNAVSTLRVDLPTISAATVENWAAAHDPLVDVLDEKLSELQHLTPEQRGMLIGELLQHYLAGEEFLQHIRTNYAEMWEAVDLQKRLRERFLETETQITDATPRQRLTGVHATLQTALLDNVAGLGTPAAELLAWATVSEWLLRCPLRLAA